MANTYFFTGFPGFITRSIIQNLIRTRPYDIDHIYLLVLPSFFDVAEAELRSIVKKEDVSVSTNQFTVIEGDITEPDLGIDVALKPELQNTVTHLFHLAAIYDLAVPKDIAYRVNVVGTEHVNRFASSLKRLKRYVYFSTAYVSGTRTGTILETELDMGQGFKNHYEHTKFEAEKRVQAVIDSVPTTIIRPGIVIGHSQTGETIKFDGPYFILNFFDRLHFLPVIPYLGFGRAEGNFVPVDYIFDAALYLGHAEHGAGRTYHLTNPHPYTMKEEYRMFMEAYLGRSPIGMIPLTLAKWCLAIPSFRRWLGTEKEALDYFTCESVYDCTQAQADLRGSGISCPDLKDLLPPIVRFYREHKDDTEKQIVIG